MHFLFLIPNPPSRPNSKRISSGKCFMASPAGYSTPLLQKIQDILCIQQFPLPPPITCGFSYSSQKWSDNRKFHQPSTQSAPNTQPPTLSWLQNPGLPEADDPPSDIQSEGQQQPKVMPIHSPHFILPHRHFISSHHHKKKGEYSIVRYFGREKESTFT